MERYQIYWTDMHSNLHHENIIEDLPKWIEQIRKTMDFWPIAYYPYYMRKDPCGLEVEDCYPTEETQRDWELLRRQTDAVNSEGFPMFMGYEWQGAGLDGDHNVFFKSNEEAMAYPLRYRDLVEAYRGRDAIGIPHHLAYQPGHRGKNWETQDDRFSPLAEIYSVHGSSENDATCIPMGRHVHMGPRTGVTCVEQGLNQGHRFGILASGDNHSCPGVYGSGLCAVLAKSCSKDDIWDALINRRVYGVSSDRIELRFTLDGHVMGSAAAPNEESRLELEIKAGDAIDRIEILKDNQVVEMIPHTSTWEKQPTEGIVRFKFRLEFGWGPDRRVFPDIESRCWSGSLKTPGKLIGIQKCWSNFGQSLNHVTDQSCDFSLTTYKTTATGKWMGPSAVSTEGFIFEVEAPVDSAITLIVDGIDYQLPVREILHSSRLFPLLEEAKQLLKERFNFTEYYRSDPWWHNCYKIKVGQGAPEAGYTSRICRTVDTSDCTNVRVRVWQRNGGAAWSSPIFIQKE